MLKKGGENMLKKEFTCDISGHSCSEKCRYNRPEILCLHYQDTSYYVCDKCLKWIDEYVEKPVAVGKNHYHEKCFKEGL